MANASVFETGYEEGLQRGGEAHARKKAVADEELQQKITDLLNQRDSLQSKFSSTLDAGGQWTDATAAVNQDILKNQSAIREFYHPDNNPNAIQKFGKMLMDRVHKPPQATSQSVTTQPTLEATESGKTLPAGPKVTVTGPAMTPKDREKFKKNQTADQAAAAAVEAAAPLSPEQIAEQQRKSAATDLQSQIDTKLAVFDRMFPHAPEEQRTQYKNFLSESILGMKPGQEVGKWTQVTGTIRGQKINLLYDEKTGTYKYQTGESVSEDDLRNFVPDPKPVKMTANDRVWDSYASSLGKTTDQLTMQDKAGFEGWMNKYKVRYNTRQVPIVDRDGNIHIEDLTSVSGPVEVGFVPKEQAQSWMQKNYPGAPLPAAGAAPSSGAPSQPTAPHHAAPAAPAGGQAGGGRTLPFKKATPAYNKLSGDIVEDQRLADYADTWINIPSGQRSEADGSLVLALVKSKAGRVNQQEINMYFNAGGIAELPERWAARTGHGELPDDLRQQLLTLIHNQLDADKQASQQMDTPPAGAAAGPQQIPPNW